MLIKDILKNKETEEKFDNEGIAGKKQNNNNYDADKFRKPKQKKENIKEEKKEN